MVTIVKCEKKELYENNVLLTEFMLELSTRELKKNFNRKFIISEYDYEFVWCVKRCAGKSSNSLTLESCSNPKEILNVCLLMFKYNETETHWESQPSVTRIWSPNDLDEFPTEIMELYSSKKRILFKINSLNKSVFTSVHCIAKNFGNLMKSQQYCDLQIVVGCEKFLAHRLILSARSSMLSVLLEKESGILEIKGMEPKIFKLLLEFIYTGYIVSEDQVTINWLELMLVAHDFKIDGLNSFCARIVAESINADNVIDVYIAADQVKEVKLKKISARFLIVNKSEIVNTEKYENLIKFKADLAIELLNKLMSNDYSF